MILFRNLTLSTESMSRKTCTKSNEVAKAKMNKNQTKFQREMISKRAITQLGSTKLQITN